MKIATGSFAWLLVANLSVSAEPSSSDDYVSGIDKILDIRSEDAHKLEQWFHFYSVGKADDEADNIWAAILKDMDKTQSIANFLERVNSRCWFAVRISVMYYPGSPRARRLYKPRFEIPWTDWRGNFALEITSQPLPVDTLKADRKPSGKIDTALPVASLSYPPEISKLTRGVSNPL